MLRNLKVINLSTVFSWNSANPLRMQDLRMSLDIEKCHMLTKNSRPDVLERVISFYVCCDDIP